MFLFGAQSEDFDIVFMGYLFVLIDLSYEKRPGG